MSEMKPYAVIVGTDSEATAKTFGGSFALAHRIVSFAHAEQRVGRSPAKSIAPDQRRLLPPHIFSAAEERCQVEWTFPASSAPPRRRGAALRSLRRGVPSQTAGCQARETRADRAAAAWLARLSCDKASSRRPIWLSANARRVSISGSWRPRAAASSGATASWARPCNNKAKPRMCSAPTCRGSRLRTSSAIRCASSGRFAFNANAARCNDSLRSRRRQAFSDVRFSEVWVRPPLLPFDLRSTAERLA